MDEKTLLDERTLNELNFKMNEIIEYLKNNKGYDYKLYNHGCPCFIDEPNSDIVEYAEDVKDIINAINNPETEDFELPF